MLEIIELYTVINMVFTYAHTKIPIIKGLMYYDWDPSYQVRDR